VVSYNNQNRGTTSVDRDCSFRFQNVREASMLERTVKRACWSALAFILIETSGLALRAGPITSSQPGLILPPLNGMPSSRLPVQQLKDHLQRNPGDREAMFVIAARAFLGGQAGEAIKVWDRIHQMDAAFPPGELTAVLLTVDAGKLDIARAQLAGLEKEQKHPAWVQLAYADLALMQGDPECMQKHVETAIKLEPKSPHPWAYRARWLLRNRQMFEAVAAVEKGLTLQPDRLDLYDQAAGIWFDLGYPEKSRALLAEAIKRDNTRVSAPLALARLYTRSRDLAGARRVSSELLQSDPDHAEALVILAQVEVASGKPDKGEPLLKKLLAKDPDHLRALLLYGELLQGQTRWDEALGCYERARKLSPTDPLIASNLALVLLEKKTEPRRALDMALQARTALGEHPGVLVALGWAEWQNGDRESAEKNLRRSIRLAPAEAWPRVLLGQLFAEQGWKEPAREQLQAALELQGAGRVAEQAKKALEGLGN
jgi:tetratricopeptide (TPR) repeat protein